MLSARGPHTTQQFAAHTHDFLHARYALRRPSVNLPAALRRGSVYVLKVVLAHRPVATVPPQTFQTPICDFLAGIEVLAVAFAGVALVRVAVEECIWHTL